MFGRVVVTAHLNRLVSVLRLPRRRLGIFKLGIGAHQLLLKLVGHMPCFVLGDPECLVRMLQIKLVLLKIVH